MPSEALVKIRETGETCGKLNCDKLYIYKRKRDKQTFAIHKLQLVSPHKLFPTPIEARLRTHYFIVPKDGYYKPEKKVVFETLEGAKKQVEEY